MKLKFYIYANISEGRTYIKGSMLLQHTTSVILYLHAFTSDLNILGGPGHGNTFSTF